MNQAVDAAIQSDKDTEISDGLDLAGDVITLIEVGRKLIPGVVLALKTQGKKSQSINK